MFIILPKKNVNTARKKNQVGILEEWKYQSGNESPLDEIRVTFLFSRQLSWQEEREEGLAIVRVQG